MKYASLGALLLVLGCGSTTSSDGTIRRVHYTGGITSGMTCEQVLYERGQPAKIEYPGPNIEEWIYVAEIPAPQRDDVIVPNPFPRQVAGKETTRTIYVFHHRFLQEIIELKPGETRKRS
jgi:hypothetical protein